MAARPVLLYAVNPGLLRKKSEPVGDGLGEAAQLLVDLKDTLLHHENGVGLAAPQIGVHKRVIVVCLGGPDTQSRRPIAIINPVIVEAACERPDFDGCLSFPDLYGETVRPHFMRLRGIDEHGMPFERTFEGFDAVVVHHEVDHLDGILFIDRVTDPNKLYTAANA